MSAKNSKNCEFLNGLLGQFIFKWASSLLSDHGGGGVSMCVHMCDLCTKRLSMLTHTGEINVTGQSNQELQRNGLPSQAD